MQIFKCIAISACICFYAINKLPAQQIPFDTYTPKDGLVNNRIKKIVQDSKGQLYFLTYGGLSIYDGARFANFTKAEGLGSDIVNDVMEMGNDSVWIATNTRELNYIFKGVLKKINTADGFYPIINSFCRINRSTLYIAADEGLYRFSGNRFIKVPLLKNGSPTNYDFINSIIPVKDYLLVITDPITGENKGRVFLYSIKENKIVADIGGLSCFSFVDIENNIWLCTADGIKIIDKLELQNGKIIFKTLPKKYMALAGKKTSLLFFDSQKNLWMPQEDGLLKIDSTGAIQKITTDNGLANNKISNLFEDREGLLWFITENFGVQKLVNSSIELIIKPFGNKVDAIAVTASGDSVFYYDVSAKKIILQASGGFKIFSLANTADDIYFITVSGSNIYLNGGRHIYQFSTTQLNTSKINPALVYTDTLESKMSVGIADANGVVTVLGASYLTSIIGKKSVYRHRIKYYADEAALDSKGHIWIASRASELYMLKTNPADAGNYLQLVKDFSREAKLNAPRSIIIDKENNIWVGTREEGVYCFKLNEKFQLELLKHITKKEGLTENFITWLYCDKGGVLWLGTSSGIDKIIWNNGNCIINNVTKSANIYPFIIRIAEDNKNNILAITQDGNLLKIGAAQKTVSPFVPQFFITTIKAGNNYFSVADAVHQFTYKENNIVFKIASPCFYDEKQIRYSYILGGSENNNWSEPVHNAEINFINLPAGKYDLKIRADYPAVKYPPKIIGYSFIINPPWWQTWWFRLMIGLLSAGMLGLVIRNYYSIKLEKQKNILEKQQIVEKERTRIAADIHDDLGAGLSTIRFLSEKVKRNSFGAVTKDDAEKIVINSNELVQKMNELIWAMNEKNDTLEDLVFYTRSYAAEYLEENNLAHHIYLPETIRVIIISGELRRNVFLTVKESLHNIVKHAGAKNVSIQISTGKNLFINIKDDGVGFDADNNKAGNGLKNMQKRMQSINGRLTVSGNDGVEVKIDVPLSQG
ncbi:MAG: two-component regulator propeller domain-containing protein [Ferruginibacter sp.]